MCLKINIQKMFTSTAVTSISTVFLVDLNIPATGGKSLRTSLLTAWR